MSIRTYYERFEARRTQRLVLTVLYVIVTTVYLGWLATYFNREAPLFSALFFAAELFGLISSLYAFFICWRVRPREPAPSRPGRTVDILIPTYNESVRLVRRTLIAAKNVRYPHETWLLDDGNRPEMRALAAELGVRYLARERNAGYKPGNLNNALRHATGEFVAVIDCDHVPERNYIEALIGYFDDPQVGFVQAPQDYYNVSAFQYLRSARGRSLWHDQDAFFKIRQAGRDYHDSATCCGTSTLLRRSAIDAIGGFPEETVTEDMHVAVRMLRKGYKSVNYPEPLAYGVAPVDLGEYQKQRLRWGQGNVRVTALEGVPFTRGLTPRQNIAFFELAYLYAEGWVRLMLYLTPIIVLTTGIGPVADVSFWQFLAFFLPYVIFSYFCFEELSRGYLRSIANECMCMARFPVYIASCFGVFFKRIRWRVSSKEFIGHLQLYLLAPQIAVFLCSLGAIAVAVLAPPALLRERYSDGVIGFVIFWAAFYGAIALAVIVHSARQAANRRADYRFRIPLICEVAAADGRVLRGVADGISEIGMTAALPSAAAAVLAQGGAVARIYMPGRVFEAAAKPDPEAGASSGRLTAALFAWSDAADRERFDMMLHSAAWHRRFMHSVIVALTPLERIEMLFRRRPDAPLPSWRTMIYRDGNGRGAWRFGLVAAGLGANSWRVVLFEPASGNAIEMLSSEALERDPIRLELAGAEERVRLQATFMDDLTAVTYRAAPIASRPEAAPAREPARAGTPAPQMS